MLKEKTPISPLLSVLVAVFVAFLIISNILANHMVQIFGWSLDAGNLTFPIIYILSDVFSEVYGYKWSRRVSYIAATMNFILGGLIILSINMPQPEWYDGSHFALGVGSSIRIVVASVTSFLAGDFINDQIFQFMKKHNPTMKGFGIRAILSSVGGQTVDTCLFISIAFLGTMPLEELWPMIYMTLLVKLAYEVVILPVTRIVAKAVHKQEDKFKEAV